MFAELHYTTLHCITSYTLHGIPYTINCNLSHFTLHCTTRHYIALHHTTLHDYTHIIYRYIPLHTITYYHYLNLTKRFCTSRVGHHYNVGDAIFINFLGGKSHQCLQAIANIWIVTLPTIIMSYPFILF